MSDTSDATGVDIDLSRVEWCKSRFSNNGGACAEFGKVFVPDGAKLHKHGDLVVVRDSKDPDGPKVFLNKEEMRALIDGMKDGNFDHLLAG
ncbi:DUF397 domain-containing protein [Nonomuraea sp. NPDC052129]|uniref:DUF397 domain-containing protein n=1 Tax=Nonomuraea sp. NPDC052129 TaxID=3154651 RepID=UPI00343412E1